MNIVKVSLQLCCRLLDRAVAPLNFYPREIKLKDVGSNNADWVRDLRIVLIAAQKAYVLNAPLGAPPPLASFVDVVNI